MKKTILILLSLILLSCGDTENLNAIKGLMPVDVYLNMEKQGFSTKKTFNSEYGNSWDNVKNENGISYSVNTFSMDMNSVESIKATAIVSPPKKIEATKDFFKFVSSIPYDNSEPQKVINWLDSNFNNDKSSIIIGTAEFTIYNPSKLTRMLTIKKVVLTIQE